jgi:hypothetical protein
MVSSMFCVDIGSSALVGSSNRSTCMHPATEVIVAAVCMMRRRHGGRRRNGDAWVSARAPQGCWRGCVPRRRAAPGRRTARWQAWRIGQGPGRPTLVGSAPRLH